MTRAALTTAAEADGAGEVHVVHREHTERDRDVAEADREVARDHRQRDAGRGEEHREHGRRAEVHEGETLEELGRDEEARRGPGRHAGREESVVNAERDDVQQEENDAPPDLDAMLRLEAVHERRDDDDRREDARRVNRVLSQPAKASAMRRCCSRSWLALLPVAGLAEDGRETTESGKRSPMIRVRFALMKYQAPALRGSSWIHMSGVPGAYGASASTSSSLIG